MRSKRVLLMLSPEREAKLKEMMLEDFEEDTPVSAYIARLISQESKRRSLDKGKRPQGRPRKGEVEEEDDEPRNIPHPDQTMNPGVYMTLSEVEAWHTLRG